MNKENFYYKKEWNAHGEMKVSIEYPASAGHDREIKKEVREILIHVLQEQMKKSCSMEQEFTSLSQGEEGKTL